MKLNLPNRLTVSRIALSVVFFVLLSQYSCRSPVPWVLDLAIVIFVIAALLTPPDVITQCLVAFPVLLLYEASILLSYWFKPPKRDR